MRLVPITVLALGACGPGTARPAGTAATGAGGEGPDVPACVEQLLGQVSSEALSIDVTDREVVWIDYNFGTLQTRPLRGGAVTTLASWKTEHNSEDLTVADGHIYWSSKAEAALYRIAIAGGKPERLASLGDKLPQRVAFAGGTLFAELFDGELAWWQPGGKTGVIKVGTAQVAVASHGDALYVGTSRGIQRLRRPTEPLETVVETTAPVVDLVVSGATLFWIERSEAADTLVRRPLAGGDPVSFPGMPMYTSGALVAAAGGAYLSMSNVVFFAGDSARELVALANAPADIGDLAIAGKSLFVTTTAGSAHQLCPDPRRPITEKPSPVEPLVCPTGLSYRLVRTSESCVDAQGGGVGPSREFYVSGHVKGRTTIDGDTTTREEFYADGSPRSVWITQGDREQWKFYYANGQLCSESDSANPAADRSYDLEGKPSR